MKTSILPSFVDANAQARMQVLRGAKSRDPEVEKARLHEAAKEFEGLLLEQMLKSMRKNVPESPIFGRNNGKEIFSEMLDGEFVKRITDRGGIGLADILVRSFEMGPRSAGVQKIGPEPVKGPPEG